MKVKPKPVFHTPIEEISITTEYIKLESFLKLCNAVETGGMAKAAIQDGQVRVQGLICTQRGRKLRPGDMVTFCGQSWQVVHDPEQSGL